MKTPCPGTATKPAFAPRPPTIKSKMAAKKAQIVNIPAKGDAAAGGKLIELLAEMKVIGGATGMHKDL